VESLTFNNGEKQFKKSVLLFLLKLTCKWFLVSMIILERDY